MDVVRVEVGEHWGIEVSQSQCARVQGHTVQAIDALGLQAFLPPIHLGAHPSSAPHLDALGLQAFLPPQFGRTSIMCTTPSHGPALQAAVRQWATATTAAAFRAWVECVAERRELRRKAQAIVCKLANSRLVAAFNAFKYVGRREASG